MAEGLFDWVEEVEEPMVKVGEGEAEVEGEVVGVGVGVEAAISQTPAAAAVVN